MQDGLSLYFLIMDDNLVKNRSTFVLLNEVARLKLIASGDLIDMFPFRFKKKQANQRQLLCF